MKLFYHSGVYSRAQKTNKRILLTFEFIHPSDILGLSQSNPC